MNRRRLLAMFLAAPLAALGLRRLVAPPALVPDLVVTLDGRRLAELVDYVVKDHTTIVLHRHVARGQTLQVTAAGVYGGTEHLSLSPLRRRAA